MLAVWCLMFLGHRNDLRSPGLPHADWKQNLIKTAVIPAAGLGSRLSPITSAIPKELVPVYDTVALFHVCEEAVRAGIQKIVIVNSQRKPALAEAVSLFFKNNRSARNEYAAPMITEVIQDQPLGLGHAVYCASESIDQFPVVVMLPDVLLPESSDLLSRMLDIGSTERSVVSVRRARPPLLNRSGVVDFEGEMEDGKFIIDLTEKPTLGEEPSDQMIIGRYVLTQQIFDLLNKSVAGATGEIELTDSIAESARQTRGAVVACELTERYQDTGTLDGLFLAGLHKFGSSRPNSRFSKPVDALIELLEQELGLSDS